MAKVPPLNFRREDIPDLATGERTDRLLRGLNAFGAESESLLNGGLTFKENFRSFTKEITFTTPGPHNVGEAGEPAFQNGWTNIGGFEPLGFYRSGGRVWIKGSVVSGSTGTILFTLPDGYRPAATTGHPLGAGIAPAYSNIYTNGNVLLGGAAGISGGVSLDGLSFAVPVTTTPEAPFPIRIKNELDRKPSHVLVTGAWVVESGTETPVSLGSVAWTESKGQVVIHSLGNVYPSKKHRVTILVVAE